MDAATPAERDSFQADLNAALQLAATANTSKYDRSKDSLFGHWAQFCQSQGWSITLSDVPDHDNKICRLLVFAERYRRKGRTNKPVKADAVAKALLAVGTGIADLVPPDPTGRPRDPRYVDLDNMHHLLSSYIKACRNNDEPPTRAYPCNVTIIRDLFEALDLNDPTYGALNRRVIDLIIVAFFWLARPAEYLEEPGSQARSEAFKLRDIVLTMGGTVYSAPTAPLNDENSIARIQYAALTFSDQKNAVRGEQVGHRATDDPLICGAKALGRIARDLRLANAPPDTPIFRHYNRTTRQWYNVRPRHITNALRHSANYSSKLTGINPMLLSARSLRPGGATALLCAGVDSDSIQLLGRWMSDAMFRYLRIQAAAHSSNYAQRMLDHGDYTFTPQAFANSQLPQEAPADVHALLAHAEIDD